MTKYNQRLFDKWMDMALKVTKEGSYIFMNTPEGIYRVYKVKNGKAVRIK